MITAILIVLAVLAVVMIVGGFHMLATQDGWVNWYMGYNAFTNGLDLLVKVLPLVGESLAEVLQGLVSN